MSSCYITISYHIFFYLFSWFILHSILIYSILLYFELIQFNFILFYSIEFYLLYCWLLYLLSINDFRLCVCIIKFSLLFPSFLLFTLFSWTSYSRTHTHTCKCMHTHIYIHMNLCFFLWLVYIASIDGKWRIVFEWLYYLIFDFIR